MSMMGKMNFYLGIHIKQDKKGIFLNQSKYAKELVKKFGMETSKISQVPINVNCKIENDEVCKDVDQKTCRSMIGHLLHLMAS